MQEGGSLKEMGIVFVLVAVFAFRIDGHLQFSVRTTHLPPPWVGGYEVPEFPSFRMIYRLVDELIDKRLAE